MSGLSIKDKTSFIFSLVADVSEEVISNLDKMPDSWGARELKQYVSDVARDYAERTPLKGEALREYKNDVIVRNL